jgi:hypothetical protein
MKGKIVGMYIYFVEVDAFATECFLIFYVMLIFGSLECINFLFGSLAIGRI